MINILLQTIKMHIKKFILIIFQFCIAFMAMLISVSFLQSMWVYKERITGLMDINTVQIYVEENDAEDVEDGDLEYEEPEILNYGQAFDELQKKGVEIAILGRANVFDESDNSIDYAIMANDSLLKQILNTSKIGKIQKLINYDIGNEVIPVIVGNGYSSEYKDGEKYTLNYVDDDCETKKIIIQVIMVGDDDMYMFTGNNSDICDTVNADRKFILMPQFADMPNEAYEYNVLVNGEEDTVEQVTKVYEQMGLSTATSSLKKQIDNYFEKNKTVTIATLLFAVIILVLSVLGCVGTLLSNTVLRKKEFGIYYAMGLSQKKLRMLLLAECITIFILSFVVSIIITKIILAVVLHDNNISMNFSGVATVMTVMLICCPICELAPLRMINRLEPIDMINNLNRQ